MERKQLGSSRDDMTHMPGEAATTNQSPATRASSLLVVDDNSMNRIMLSRYISKLGYQAALVENGRQALDKLQGEPFDLVLLDVQMPEMDGYQVLEQLKADPRLRDIPVIMISAVEELESVVRCIELGAQDYLPKPFNPVLLRATQRVPGTQEAARPGGRLFAAGRASDSSSGCDQGQYLSAGKPG